MLAHPPWFKETGEAEEEQPQVPLLPPPWPLHTRPLPPIRVRRRRLLPLPNRCPLEWAQLPPGLRPVLRCRLFWAPPPQAQAQLEPRDGEHLLPEEALARLRLPARLEPRQEVPVEEPPQLAQLRHDAERRKCPGRERCVPRGQLMLF